MNKKVLVAIVALTITLPICAINRTAIKNLFISSSVAEYYVTHFRDGQDIDADHLVTKLHNGMSIVVNKYDRCVCWFVRLMGYWDSSETKALGRIIKTGDNVVEVGSNFGVHTLYIANLVGEHGQVYAFEANPHVSKYLKQSIDLNNLGNNVKIYEMALANKHYNGFMTYGVANIGGGFILPDDQATQELCKDGSCTPIHVRILDDILPNHKIDVLKMDAEGSEFWVLEGAKSLIANPELTIIMEWNTAHLRRNGVDINSFITLLKNDNFHVWSIGRGGKLTPISYASLESDATYDLVLSRDAHKFST